MKKFILLYVGFDTPSAEIQEAWGTWFASIAGSVVDSGNPFGPGREVLPAETRELPLGKTSITGYTIINAADLDEATRIARTCPMVTSVRVYEALAM